MEEPGIPYITLDNRDSGGNKWSIQSHDSNSWMHDGLLLFRRVIPPDKDPDEGNYMVIDGDGNVGIGVLIPGYKLDVAGAAHASSHPTSSDARFKKNVVHLTNVLEKIERIRGISFDWNELYESFGRASGHREIGIIAQEVEEVFPELITTWGDENYRAVDYGRLTGVLIEAIKELKAEMGQLKAENDAQIEQLRVEIGGLKSKI